MAICQFCGCKTEELDFVKSSINGLETDACSFCHRQLSAFSSGTVSDAHIKWLKTIAGKEVLNREKDVTEEITRLLEKHGEIVDVPAPSELKTNEPFSSVENKQENNPMVVNHVINDLMKRVEDLELQLSVLKIKQIRRTIVEIFASIIIAIVILLVFAKSGVVISMY